MQSHQLILVVEDDHTVRELTLDTLEALGYQTKGAANAEQALAFITEFPDISLVITDLGLPDMSGKELAEKIKQLAPSIHILIASGYIQNQRLVGMHSTSPLDSTYHLIAKPFTLDQLKRTIESIYCL